MKNLIWIILCVSMFFVQCSDDESSDNTPAPATNEYIEFTFNGRQYRNDRDPGSGSVSDFTSIVSGTRILINEEYLSITTMDPMTPFTYPEDIELSFDLNNISATCSLDCYVGSSSSFGEPFWVGDVAFGPYIGIYDQCPSGNNNGVNSYVNFNFTSIPTSVGGFYQATFQGVLEESSFSGATAFPIQGSFRIKRTS